MHAAIDLIKKFWMDYIDATRYNENKMPLFISKWTKENDISNQTRNIISKSDNTNKVGYIVATCSPATRAHLALAQQAINELCLDKLFFIIWPFFYIKNFHSDTLEQWVNTQRHINWDERIELLEAGISDIQDERIIVLTESKKWYEESKDNYNEADVFSAFWTGTWYVIRKLQFHIKKYNPGADFTFVCGTDQFNPNIEQLVYSRGQLQVWKDYSVSQHLAIHNIYAVPRLMDGVENIEEFVQPFGCPNFVKIGIPLSEEKLSATNVRFKKLIPGLELEDYVTISVAKRLREKGLWGYKKI